MPQTFRKANSDLGKHKGAWVVDNDEEGELWVAFGGDMDEYDLPTKGGAFSRRADHFFIMSKRNT